MIRPLNELTKKNVPFKWTKQCQKSLDYVKEVITMVVGFSFLSLGEAQALGPQGYKTLRLYWGC